MSEQHDGPGVWRDDNLPGMSEAERRGALNPKATELFFVEPHEAELLLALRADPDQHRHIVDATLSLRGDLVVTVRHPIAERLQPETLFTCRVLHHADAWLAAQRDPVGRYRLVGPTGPEQSFDFERVSA